MATPRQEAAAQALLFAVAALAAAGAFAIVGLTTVVMAVAIPAHLGVALTFAGIFVLVAIGTGLGTLWMRTVAIEHENGDAHGGGRRRRRRLGSRRPRTQHAGR
jgi:hypothetical protein